MVLEFIGPSPFIADWKIGEIREVPDSVAMVLLDEHAYAFRIVPQVTDRQMRRSDMVVKPEWH